MIMYGIAGTYMIMYGIANTYMIIIQNMKRKQDVVINNVQG